MYSIEVFEVMESQKISWVKFLLQIYCKR